jgi:hypothetical protein
MATKQQLHEARKRASDAGISLIYQAEILLHVGDYYIKPKAPAERADVEIALLDEIINC